MASNYRSHRSTKKAGNGSLVLVHVEERDIVHLISAISQNAIAGKHRELGKIFRVELMGKIRDGK